MKLAELLRGVAVTDARANLETEISGICIDSRRIGPGDLFVAVSRGFGEDRHEYISAALQSGAVCVLCEKPPENASVHYILTADTRLALASVSANFYGNPAARLKLIGVTGTNGKTTVTSLIKAMLETLADKPVGLIGTNRNMVGDAEYETGQTTPEAPELHALFAKMVAAGCEYAVMEVSSHALALDRVAGLEFEVAVFTNLTEDHLDFHSDMDEYAQAKAKLFRSSRRAAVNRDDPYSAVMAENAPGEVSAFSVNDDNCDIVAKRVKLSPGKVEFSALTIGSLLPVELG
ncbi:MAG: Mur ligase domain-containing protein, partial [Oscillospiraceae bacterium]|nr:Mur ligase domain-containing protein [Oscillospiraceae bacterium]